jgi:hypothetical protein
MVGEIFYVWFCGGVCVSVCTIRESKVHCSNNGDHQHGLHNPKR